MCGACALHADGPKLNRGEGAAVFTFGMLVAGSLLGVFGFEAILATDWANLRPMVWVTIGYLTLFSTASSFFLLQYATLRLPSAKVMAYSYLTPAWVMLWELGFGSALPPVPVLLGIMATVVALLMLLRNEAARRLTGNGRFVLFGLVDNMLSRDADLWEQSLGCLNVQRHVFASPAARPPRQAIDIRTAIFGIGAGRRAGDVSS